MPIHDWTRVQAGVFHHFHHGWIAELSNGLNGGGLPPSYYAIAEQITGSFGPDVLTLQLDGPRTNGSVGSGSSSPGGAVALAVAPPKVWFQTKGELDRYAAKAKIIAIRHSSNHRIVAVIEIVSPGNKNTRQKLDRFVDKAVELLRAGVHLLVIDLFPPSPFHPQGIHKLIWDEVEDCPFALPEGRPLTLASYVAGEIPAAYVEPMAVGLSLTDMPLFLTPEIYVPIPLERTYQSAWEAVPAYWREALTRAPGDSPGG